MDKNICKVEDCTRRHQARGWCMTHYARWRRTGTVDLIERTFQDRYREKVKPQGDCLVWEQSPSQKTHPVAYYEGQTMPAHRAVWLDAGRTIPEGKELNHICWTIGCVNLVHLEVVTKSQNQQYRQGPNKNNTSGYRNVYYRKRHKKWSAQVYSQGKNYYGPLRDTPEEANEDAIELRSELHHTGFLFGGGVC